MNWLAKINFNIVIERLGPYRSAFFLLSLVAICLFCGYRAGNFYHAYQGELLSNQQTRLDSLYQMQEQQLSRIHSLEVELEVDRMTNQQAQNDLKALQAELFQTKTSLAFYESVMAPEKKANGLVLDKFKLFASGSHGHYRFQMVLVQQEQKKNYVKGQVEFVINGTLNNKQQRYTMSEVSTLSKENLAFSFRYFQLIEGEITLPEGFAPEHVKLSIITPQRRGQKYSRIDQSYTWLEALE